MRLVLRAVLFHFQTHWSNKGHFWSGVLGMIVNNSLTLLGIWAMLFAGKEGLSDERDTFLLMNFVLMIAYGFVHAFLGGVSSLDKQISEGGLDLALTTPRNPFFMLSITSSHLPAWGDLILGFFGLLAYAIFSNPWALFHGLLMAVFASLTMFAFLLVVGSLAFWFRRTDAAYSVLINMFLAFNTYPMPSTGTGMRWIIFLAPALMAGVIPATYILHPSWQILAGEIGGSILFYFIANRMFHFGMKKYQSSSVLGLQRT